MDAPRKFFFAILLNIVLARGKGEGRRTMKGSVFRVSRASQRDYILHGAIVARAFELRIALKPRNFSYLGADRKFAGFIFNLANACVEKLLMRTGNRSTTEALAEYSLHCGMNCFKEKRKTLVWSCETLFNFSAFSYVAIRIQFRRNFNIGALLLGLVLVNQKFGGNALVWNLYFCEYNDFLSFIEQFYNSTRLLPVAL